MVSNGEDPAGLTRRRFLGQSALGLGALAMMSLLDERLFAESPVTANPDPLAPKPPHFPAKAKRVIYLNMTGAPSQLDMLDYKPKLVEMHLEKIPASVIAGQRFSTMTDLKGELKVLGPNWPFRQAPGTDQWFTELMPRFPEILGEITLIKSMQTDEVNHVPAQLLMSSGSPRMGRPTMGSWVTYGLGTENRNFPGYVVLTSGKAGRCGTICWGSGFMPSVYQGVPFRSSGDPVLHLSNPEGLDDGMRRASLDAVRDLNGIALQAMGDPEIASRISAYEMAYRMQTSVPELMDLSKEPPETLKAYGAEPGKGSFANNCLLARRLIERGVRFVQLDHGGWDHHGGGDQNLVSELPKHCKWVDAPSVALVQDLKQRGLLDDTLVIWGGEFGRSAIMQGVYSKENLGRDHLRAAFTWWMAGGGIKKGFTLGKTDDFGMNVVEDPIHVHDMQATILHCLGLEHTKLTYRFQGRDFRLTDVHGKVVEKLLA